MENPDKPPKRKNSNTPKKSQVNSPSQEAMMPYAYINDDLIRKVTNEYDFTKIIVLNFHLKLKNEAKIKKIEGLSKLVNLEELNLSYNLISYIENLEGLKQLRDLNLAENTIKKIENIESLTNLEKLNLNGNLIKQIPDSIRSLKKLNTLRLARNRIEDTEKIMNIQHLPVLKYFSIAENPINVSPGIVDFCLYLNPRIEMIDTKKVTGEHRKTMNKIFLMSKNKENEDFDPSKIFQRENELQKQNDQLKEAGNRLDLDKSKLKEENELLRKINKEQEEEIKALREELDRKNRELASNFEKISLLEHEVSQYKIDLVYSRFGTETENRSPIKTTLTSHRQSLQTETDDLAKIEYKISEITVDSHTITRKTISMLLVEKKENKNKLEDLRLQKDEYYSEISQIRDKIQKLEDEIEFMNKKFLKETSFDRSISPIKSQRDKELELASLQVHSEQLKDKSMDLVSKIETTREKIRKTTNLLEKTRITPENEGDRLVLKEKIQELKDKLRGYEKANDDIVAALARSNRQLRALGEDVSFDRRSSLSANKNSRFSVRSTHSTQENDDLWRIHYGSNMEQIKELRMRESELVEKHERTDLQIDYLTKQIESCEERVSHLHRDRSSFESKLGTNNRPTHKRSVSQSMIKTKRDEAPEQNEDAVRTIKIRIMGALTSIKQVLLRVDDALGGNTQRTNIIEVEDLIVALNRDKTEGTSGLDKYLQKINGYIDIFTGKLEGVLSKNKEDRIELEKKLQEKQRTEKEMREQLLQKESRIQDILSNKEGRLNEVTFRMEEVRSKKEEIIQAMKKIIQKAEQYKKRIDGDELDTSSIGYEDLISRRGDDSEDLNRTISALSRVLRWIEKNLMRVDAFNNEKNKFIKELEREAKEISDQWKELGDRKIQLREKIFTERDDNIRQVREEYAKLQEECKKLENEKRMWNEDRIRIEREKRDLMEDITKTMNNRDITTLELKKDQEHKLTIKQSYENEILSLKKQFENLRQEVTDYEIKRDRARLEFNEIVNKNDGEIKGLQLAKEELEKAERNQQKLREQRETLRMEIQHLEEEKQILSMQIQGTKNQLKYNEDDYKQNLERIKFEEKNTKKIIEGLDHEANKKREIINELDEKLVNLNEEISFKENELAIIQRKMEEHEKEKEVFRRNRMENAQLEKEIEESRMTLEQLIFKMNMQEENLTAAKNQLESTTIMLKEKQNEILQLDKNINHLNDMVHGYELRSDQLKQECEAREEEIKAIEAKKCDLFNEYDRIYERINEVEPDLMNKEGELASIETEISQKVQELNELNQMIQENDSKYRKTIKENHDALDQSLQNLRDKEEDYRALVNEIERLNDIKDEAENDLRKMEREAEAQQQHLQSLTENIEHSQNEIQSLNDKILHLTEKESALEEKIQKYSEIDQSYSNKLAELEHNIEALAQEEEELIERVGELQQREDATNVMMALNGEVVSDRAQQRIRKMVENHFTIAELQANMEKIISENKQLKHQISQSRTPATKTQQQNQQNENEPKNSSFNYRLNFSKGTLAGNKRTPFKSNIDQENSDILGESGDTLDNFTLPMPLKNSTKENKPRGQVKSTEITGEDFYKITSEGTNEVMRKIEEARRQIVSLERESRKHTEREKNEEEYDVNEFGTSDNFTMGNLEATS